MAKPVVLVQLDPGSPPGSPAGSPAGSQDAAQFAKALAELVADGSIDLRFSAPPPSIPPPRSAGEEYLRATEALASEVEVWTGANIADSFLEKAQRLRWVSFFSAGVDGKLSPRLLERGLHITTASGVHGPNVAEHVLAFMLCLTHGFPEHFRDQASHLWKSWSGTRSQGGEMAGQTLAIVGLGRIGAALARRAKALDLTVLAVKRDPATLPDGFVAGSVDRLAGVDALDEILPAADHVAICAPLTGETRHLFDRERLARMKRGSFLYNSARGGLIDTSALVDALRSGQIGGAGLDVFEQEPLPADSPLWDQPNVIVTPHSAGVTPRYYERAAALFAANLKRYLAGEPLRQEYSVERGY
jgi:phosphoglycerate dehydrogenase-like enzyme